MDGYCPFCEKVTGLMSSGLCLDCELMAMLYKVGRTQFLREIGLKPLHHRPGSTTLIGFNLEAFQQVVEDES